MATIFNNVKKSEDEVGEKYDRFLTNAITHTASGLGVGLLASLIAFRRKTWPITLGGGFGFGVAFGNCQSEFRNIYPKQKPLTAVNDSITVAAAVEQNAEVTLLTTEVPVEIPVVPVDVPETELEKPAADE